MSNWKIVTGDEKLKAEIEYQKNSFDEWFNVYWGKHITKEEMLSEDSPVPPIYYKLTKTFEEVKEKYPLSAREDCDTCGNNVDTWIEIELDEDKVYFCEKCVTEFNILFEKRKIS